MRRILGAAIAALAAGCFALQQPIGAAEGGFEGSIVPVADGVWAVLQPERLRFADGNAAIVDLGDGVMVVDTFVTPSKARSLLVDIRRLTNKPVTTVVNTHFHGDHVQGNQAFEEASPGQVTFIAHEATREDIQSRAVPMMKEEQEMLPGAIERTEKILASGVGEDGTPLTDDLRERYRRGVAYRRAYLAELSNLRFILPTMTFEERLTLHGGGREARLLHFRAHSRGDLVVHLPAEKILITGDLLDDLPYAGHGYPAEWIGTLKSLAALDFDRIIPGHGRVRQGKEHLLLVTAWLESIVAQVKAAVAAGKSLDAARKEVDVSSFRARFVGDDALAARTWDQFVPEAISRAWQEATGTIDDPSP